MIPINFTGVEALFDEPATFYEACHVLTQAVRAQNVAIGDAVSMIGFLFIVTILVVWVQTGGLEYLKDFLKERKKGKEEEVDKEKKE